MVCLPFAVSACNAVKLGRKVKLLQLDVAVSPQAGSRRCYDPFSIASNAPSAMMMKDMMNSKSGILGKSISEISAPMNGAKA